MHMLTMHFLTTSFGEEFENSPKKHRFPKSNEGKQPLQMRKWLKRHLVNPIQGMSSQRFQDIAKNTQTFANKTKSLKIRKLSKCHLVNTGGKDIYKVCPLSPPSPKRIQQAVSEKKKGGGVAKPRNSIMGGRDIVSQLFFCLIEAWFENNETVWEIFRVHHYLMNYQISDAILHLNNNTKCVICSNFHRNTFFWLKCINLKWKRFVWS